jgi:hypothetical protein
VRPHERTWRERRADGALFQTPSHRRHHAAHPAPHLSPLTCPVEGGAAGAGEGLDSAARGAAEALADAVRTVQRGGGRGVRVIETAATTSTSTAAVGECAASAAGVEDFSLRASSFERRAF